MSKSRNDRQSKERRQKEATERNERWAKLTPTQQLEQLDKLKLNASKQRERIRKQLAK